MLDCPAKINTLTGAGGEGGDPSPLPSYADAVAVTAINTTNNTTTGLRKKNCSSDVSKNRRLRRLLKGVLVVFFAFLDLLLIMVDRK
jgi:hypothetical protein